MGEDRCGGLLHVCAWVQTWSAECIWYRKLVTRVLRVAALSESIDQKCTPCEGWQGGSVAESSRDPLSDMRELDTADSSRVQMAIRLGVVGTERRTG